MKIVNLFGGPGTGKSTTASGVFHEMKKMRLEVELVTEYAKDMTWEGRTNVLSDQLYVLAKQNRRLERLKNHQVDWVVSDSPLLLGLIYQQPGYYQSFNSFVLEVFNSYQNINILLNRDFEYNPIGRNQTADEAVHVDEDLKRLLDKNSIHYHTFTNDPQVDRVNQILGLLKPDLVNTSS